MQLKELKQFIIDRDIVSIPDVSAEALVEEAPPYRRSNLAYINIPGPYEKNLPWSIVLFRRIQVGARKSSVPIFPEKRICCLSRYMRSGPDISWSFCTGSALLPRWVVFIGDMLSVRVGPITLKKWCGRRV